MDAMDDKHDGRQTMDDIHGYQWTTMDDSVLSDLLSNSTTTTATTTTITTTTAIITAHRVYTYD